MIDVVVIKQGSQRLNVGCWNMRTLVESDTSDGSIATDVFRKGGRGAAGVPGTEEELSSLMLKSGKIECMSDFKYLG